MKKAITTVSFAVLLFTNALLATGDTSVNSPTDQLIASPGSLCKSCVIHPPLAQDFESKISVYIQKVKLIRDNKDWRLLANSEELEEVAAMLEANERAELECELAKKDFTAKYHHHRKAGNDASDEELVSFLLNYPRWDKLLSATREWVIAKVARK